MLFFIFQLPHVLVQSSMLLTNFFEAEKSCVKRWLNAVSAIPKYFLSGLLGADAAALYTIFPNKYLLPSVHFSLFL